MNRFTLTFTKLGCFRHLNIEKHFRMIGHVRKIESEYSDTPLYPPIENIKNVSIFKKINTDWHTKIKNLPTVEQKLIELNMPKYYGYHTVILKEETLKPVCLDFLKFITRTKVINNLPFQYYEEHEVNIERVANSISKQVQDLIILHFGTKISRVGNNPILAEHIQNENFIIDLNNLIMKCLDQDISHLSPSAVDLCPRIEGFWFVGGFKLPSLTIKRKEGRKDAKCFANERADKAMRSSIRPTLALRMKEGLPNVVPLDSTGEEFENKVSNLEDHQAAANEQSSKPEEESTTIDPFKTEPVAWGFPSGRRRAVIIPGFWPGVEAEHANLFFHKRSYLNQRLGKYREHGETIKPVMLQQRAVLAGFTQALSYAMYQGFTPVNEMTYPIVQQYVSTDGRNWQFGLYQLNTCSLHSTFSTDNPRKNLLWLSKDTPLFESVDGQSVKGFNVDVLKVLCAMYLKKGEKRAEPHHPYLADYKYLMHHDAPEEYKDEFQKWFHSLMSDRCHGYSKPEILPWERIYKIYFKTRPMDRKTKFFENEWAMNPIKRRLDEYLLPYIPKVRRINHKIKRVPRLNSEHLFKHDWLSIKKARLYSDNEIAFKTMNIRKETPPYYNGLLWSRGMMNKPIKI